MAIIPMKKLSLFALSQDREQLLRDLTRIGCFEITEPDSSHYEEFKNAVTKDVSSSKEATDNLNEIINALKALEKFAPVKTGLFFQRHLVQDGDFNSPQNVEAALEAARKINSLHKDIINNWNFENKLQAIKTAVKPWSNCDLSLDCTGTEETEFVFGACPSSTDIDAMKMSLSLAVPESTIEIINSDKEQFYLLLIVHKQQFDKAFSIVKEYDFGRVQFTGIVDTAKDCIIEADRQLDSYKIERDRIQEDLKTFIVHKTDLEKSYDAINIEVNREKIRDKLVKTEKVLVFTGWVAVDEEKSITNLLSKYICAYEFRDPYDDEQPPVKIKNSALVRPFGIVTELYSLPDPRGIDPNASMSIFFFICFGIMVSDAGYGLIIAGLCYYLMRKYSLRGMTKQLISLLLLGGISTIIWGVLFGSWFGDVVPVVSKLITGKEFIIKPLWFNPLVDPMKMLFFSFAIGLVHIFWGMALNAWMLIRRGKWLDAVFDVGFWYCLIIGLLVMLINFEVGKYMSLIGAAGLVLTQGRSKKGVISKFISGVLSLYNITAYLSDVLSYSRLLALGLATGVIASVINNMGALLSGSIIGTIAMVVILIGGNIFNLAINTLGAYVHSSRLQYIEFFGKFYESGGVAYRPAFMETKYVDIVKEN